MADKENVAESAATGQRQPRRAAVPPQVRDDSVPVSFEAPCSQFRSTSQWCVDPRRVNNTRRPTDKKSPPH
jgi:hypothetical protein